MLKSIEIQHFKSLADVRLELGNVTLLVGPNGSGKSNIIDSLRFLRDAATYGLEYAVSERGGIDMLRQYSPTRPYLVSMRTEFSASASSDNQTYSLRLSGSGGEAHIENEESFWLTESTIAIDYETHGDRAWFRVQRDKHGHLSHGPDSAPYKEALPPDELSLGNYLSPIGAIGGEISTMFRSMRFAAIYPNILRAPSRPDTDKHLKEDCSNWASIIKALRQTKKGKESLASIKEIMARVIPGFQEIAVKGVGGYLVPQFLVKEKPDAKAHYFDPLQLSDGTLRMFGLLLALYQEPRPTFLALEEPELTVHPAMLALLADAIREVSETTQLVITTHSPYLLDSFDPDEIQVVNMEQGETKVAPIRRAQVESVKEGLISLSEVMALDGLQAEASP